MLKVELPQPDALEDAEAAVEERPPGRPGAALDWSHARPEGGLAVSANAGGPYRRIFACASSNEEPDEPAKT